MHKKARKAGVHPEYIRKIKKENNKERTLCDIIQTRHAADKFVLLNAIKRYIASEDKDLVLLVKYAKLFKVEGAIRPYIEILL